MWSLNIEYFNTVTMYMFLLAHLLNSWQVCVNVKKCVLGCIVKREVYSKTIISDYHQQKKYCEIQHTYNEKENCKNFFLNKWDTWPKGKNMYEKNSNQFFFRCFGKKNKHLHKRKIIQQEEVFNRLTGSWHRKKN